MPVEEIKVVVQYLDELMESSPSREIADACNYLAKLIEDQEG